MAATEKLSSARVVFFGRRSSVAVLFSTLLVLLIITVICLFNATQFINKPFPGFLINERMLVAPIGQYQWSGTQAGLKYPDKILGANGTPVHTAEELYEYVSNEPIGTLISYEVEQKGKIIMPTIATMRFTLFDFLMNFGTYLLSGVAYLLIGLTVYILKPDTIISWIFFVACTFLSLWQITVFDMQSTHFGFIRFYLFANTFFPAAFIHFSFYFPETNRFVSKHKFIQYLPYAVGFIIAIPMLYYYPRDGFKPFYAMTFYYMIISILLLLYSIIIAFFKSESVLARQRAKLILAGAVLAFLIPGTAYFSQLIFGSFLGIRIHTNYLSPLLIIFPGSIAYAIAKHNLFDVDVFIKRAVGYVIITAVVVGVYAIISITFSMFMGQYQIAQSRAFPLLFTLGIILIFNPLRDRVQTFVDRTFFRKEYDYGQVVDKIGNAITSMMDLGHILKHLTRTFIEDIFINTSAVMLLNPESTAYQVYLVDGEDKENVSKVVVEKSAPLMEIIEREKKEITKFDILEDPKYRKISKVCAATFDALRATLLIPLIYQEKVIGLLSMGEKKSGKFFNREDIDLFHTLANQGAVAIENARLFQENLEKQRMEEELAIGRDLQMSMLPAICPEVKGFQIAAFSEPAMEVGGDFYDFIEAKSGDLGFIIGDVTGKSVSGALVMSASRSIFRMLSEEKLSVADIMMRANRRSKKDIKSGMFVALLYALLNPNAHSLVLCSAGQTQPVYYSGKDRKVKLIETKGDTFPLGILEDVDYEETQVALNPGDKVIFYTDGIVEAMNAKEELYGFERLLEVVQKNGALPAEPLLKSIKTDVADYVGDSPQHDDLTVIVLSVDKKIAQNKY